MGCSNSKAEVAADTTKQGKPDAPRRRRSRHRRSADPEPEPPERTSSAGAENPLQTQPRLFEVMERKGSPQQQQGDGAQKSAASVADWSPSNRSRAEEGPLGGAGGGGVGVGNLGSLPSHTNEQEESDSSPTTRVNTAVYSPPVHELGPLGPSTHCPGFSGSSLTTVVVQ